MDPLCECSVRLITKDLHVHEVISKQDRAKARNRRQMRTTEHLSTRNQAFAGLRPKACTIRHCHAKQSANTLHGNASTLEPPGATRRKEALCQACAERARAHPRYACNQQSCTRLTSMTPAAGPVLIDAGPHDSACVPSKNAGEASLRSSDRVPSPRQQRMSGPRRHAAAAKRAAICRYRALPSRVQMVFENVRQCQHFRSG